MSPFLDDYEPVEARLARFWTDHPTGRVLTVLERYEGDLVVVRAEVYRDPEGGPAATGYAQEREGSSNVNKTSALENCETSAIGRALANLGYAPKGKRPSREEMAKASAPPLRNGPSPSDGAEPRAEGKAQPEGEGRGKPNPPSLHEWAVYGDIGGNAAKAVAAARRKGWDDVKVVGDITADQLRILIADRKAELEK